MATDLNSSYAGVAQAIVLIAKTSKEKSSHKTFQKNTVPKSDHGLLKNVQQECTEEGMLIPHLR